MRGVEADRPTGTTNSGMDAGYAAPGLGADDLGFIADLKNGSATSDAVERLASERPWGAYRRLDVGNRYQVKRITVVPGGRLSLQKHHHRAEHWVVVAGTAEVTIGERTTALMEGQSVFIQTGELHRLANTGKVPVELIEVQIGTYTGEDDIIRLDDVYGRV